MASERIGVRGDCVGNQEESDVVVGIPFEIYSDHSSLQKLASVAERNNRLQRLFDFLSAYT